MRAKTPSWWLVLQQGISWGLFAASHGWDVMWTSKITKCLTDIDTQREQQNPLSVHKQPFYTQPLWIFPFCTQPSHQGCRCILWQLKAQILHLERNPRLFQAMLLNPNRLVLLKDKIHNGTSLFKRYMSFQASISLLRRTVFLPTKTESLFEAKGTYPLSTQSCSKDAHKFEEALSQVFWRSGLSLGLPTSSGLFCPIKRHRSPMIPALVGPKRQRPTSIVTSLFKCRTQIWGPYVQYAHLALGCRIDHKYSCIMRTLTFKPQMWHFSMYPHVYKYAHI